MGIILSSTDKEARSSTEEAGRAARNATEITRALAADSRLTGRCQR